MITVHDNVLEAVKRFRLPATAPVIQSETNPKLSYPTVLACLNDLVRKGVITEGSNEVGKRTFEAKEK